MPSTIDLSLESSRRHVRASADDVRSWAGAADADLAARAAALGRIVARVIGDYAWMAEVDRLFRQSAGNARPNEETARRAEAVAAEFADYAALAGEALQSVAGLPADHRPPADQLDELRRVQEAADELASVYRGEAEYFRGMPGVSWEAFRKTLGV